MNKEIYVKETPECCEDCPVHNGTNGICKLSHKYTYDTPPKDCPLKSLHEHDKELVEKVLKEVEDSFTAYLPLRNRTGAWFYGRLNEIKKEFENE